MNILIVNPTSDASLNDIIYQTADHTAKLTARNSEDYTHVSVISLSDAPEKIVTALDVVEVSSLLLQKVRSMKGIYDGIIIAHHTELGVAALRELTGQPVISSGSASVYSAPLYGRHIAVIGKTARSLEATKDALRLYGLLNDNMQFYATAEPGATLGELRAALPAAGRQAKEEGADVIALSDVGFSGLGDDLSRMLHLPVLEGVMSALIRIELMVLQHQRVTGEE